MNYTTAFFLLANTILSYCSILPDNSTHFVVIADIHGDMVRFKSILQSSNVIDKTGNWILQPNSVVVQLGDQIDPKRDDKKSQRLPHFDVILYTEYLKKLAAKNDCDFISIVGNHEHMNIGAIKKDPELSSIVSNRPIVHIASRYMFCHGIFKRRHYEILEYFKISITQLNDIWRRYVLNLELSSKERGILQALVLDTEKSILYSKDIDTKEDTQQLMQLMKIDSIFIGHIKVKKIQVVNNIWFLDLYLKETFFKYSYNNIVIKDSSIHVEPLKIIYY